MEFYKQIRRFRHHIFIYACFIFLLFVTHKLFAEEIDPAYLSETMECQFTPELKELAKELEYDIVKIFNWVNKNIEYEDYGSTRKGANCTFLTKSGNEWDQSALLIALLRISNIPARYIIGIKLDDLTGDFSYSCGVEAWCSMDNYRDNEKGDKKIWIPVLFYGDRDRYNSFNIEKGIDLFPNEQIPEELNFNFGEYVSTVKQKMPLELFEERLQQYLTLHYPGKSLKDIPAKKLCIKKPISILSSYNYEDNFCDTNDAQSDFVVSVKLSFKKADGFLLLEREVYLPEIAGRRFCLDFIPASDKDRQIISNYGGMCKTPANAAQLKPVLRLDGKIIQEGVPIYTGEEFYPVIGDKKRPCKKVGTFIQIALDALCASNETIEKAKKELKNIPISTALNDATREEYLGRISHILITTFMLREYETMKRVNELLHCKSFYLKNDSNFLTLIYTFPQDVEKANESKFLLHPVWNIDTIVASDYVERVEGNKYLDPLDPFNMFRNKLICYEMSYNEGRIFEDWQDTSGVCTIKGLMLANEQGIPVVTLTKNDIISGHLPILENETQDRIDDIYIQAIIDELNDEQTITLPIRKIKYQDMIFTVYMSIGPKRIGMLFDDENGGASSPVVIKDTSLENNTGNFGASAAAYTNPDGQININEPTVNRQTSTAGDPVDMATGEFYHEENPDFQIKSRGVNLDIIRKYKSKLIFNGPFGYGWAWNHSQRLLISDNGDIIFYNADCNPCYLTSNGNGTYQYPAGTTFVMKKEGNGYVLTEKDKSKIFFSEAGLLLKKEDPNGNALTFDYDAQEQLIKITDPLGRYLSFYYNGSGKIVQVSDFRGGSCFYDYDGDDLIRFTDIEGNIYSYEYLKNEENPAKNHNMSKYILPNGDYLEIAYYEDDTVEFHRNKKDEEFHFFYSRLNGFAETWDEEGYYRKVIYNKNNDVIRISTRDKNIELKGYDNQHNIVSYTDANGYTTDFTYDSRRNLISKTNALTEKWQYEYDSVFNKPTKIIDPKGSQTVFEYDNRGNLIKSTDALGNITSYAYDEYGNMIKTTDAKSFTQETTYDSQGLNPVEIKDKNGNRTIYQYDDASNMISETDPAYNTTSYEYNKYNQKTKITDALGNVTKFEYDSNRFLTKLIEPNEAVTQNIYDTVRDMVAGAKIKQIIDPLEKKEEFNYDKLGNMISKTDKKGNTVYFSYDQMNRLIETTDPFQNVVRNSYDGNGNIVSIADRRENSTIFSYDAANRKISVTDPQGNKILYEYDKNGKLIKEANALGLIIKYEYDKLNHLIKKTIGDGLTKPRIFKFEYNELGRVIKNTDPLGNYTIVEYDPNGNKIKETVFDNPQEKLSETSYVYDNRNLLIKKNDPRGNIWQFEYNKLKQKTAEIDPLGNRVEYAYDKAGNIRAVKDQLGNVTAFTYNLRKEKITETDSYGNTKQFYYDNNGNLIEIRDESGHANKYNYDSLNRKIEEINALGAETILNYDKNSNLVGKALPLYENRYCYEYDKNNQLIKQINPWTTLPITFEYDTGLRLVKTKDAQGSETGYEYNEFNEIITETNALQEKTTREYDSFGRLVNIADAKGINTVTEYDPFGRAIKIIQVAGMPEEAVTRFEYDANGNKTREINALGAIIIYEYDPRNLLIKKTLVDGSGSEDIIYRYEYDAKGQLVKLIDPRTNSTVFAYDKLGRKISQTSPEGNTTALEYDKTGNLILETSPEGKKISYEYDAVGHRIKTSIDGKEKLFFYDAKGRLIKEIDFNGNSTVYEYYFEQVSKKVEGWGTDDNVEINFSYYDANMNLRVISGVAGIVTGEHIDFEYDRLNRRVSEYDCDRSVRHLRYDQNGNLVRLERRNGEIIERSFDNLNRLTQVRAKGGLEQVFYYDKLSRMTKAVDYNSGRKTHTVEYEYDCFNRVTAEIQDGRKIVKKYDVNSNLNKVIYPSGRVVEKSFTALNFIKDISYQYNKIATFQYDKDSRLETASFTNGITQSLAYNNMGLEIERKYIQGINIVSLMNSSYDADENVLQEKILCNNKEIIKNYTYDKADRIKQEDTSSGGIFSWQYDSRNNWVHTNQNGEPEDFDANFDNEYQIGLESSSLRLKSIRMSVAPPPPPPSVEELYDDNGNLVTYGNKEYIYDWADRLIKVDQNGQTIAGYTYDALGRRVIKYTSSDAKTLTFVHDGNQIIEEYSSFGSAERMYVYGNYIDEPVMMETNGQRYYYFNDRSYNIIALVNESGSVVEQYAYSAYGLMSIFDGSGIARSKSSYGNAYGYTGRYYDAETGLWYYRNRMYIPELGRFLQRDPLGYTDGINLYAYARNNPLRYLDPMGLTARDNGELFPDLWTITQSNFISTVTDFPKIVYTNIVETFNWPAEHPEEAMMFILMGELNVANTTYQDVIKPEIKNVYHSVTSEEAAQSVINKIDPKFFNPNSRFGRAFYISEQAETAVTEVAAHDAQSTHNIRFSLDLEKQNILDLSNPSVAKNWGYSSKLSYKATQSIAMQAQESGYNVIKFSSVQGQGNNYAIFKNFNEIIKPQGVAPVTEGSVVYE